MSISSFANEHRQMDDWLRVPVRRAYREQKRAEAEERQAEYDALLANGVIRPRLGRQMRATS